MQFADRADAGRALADALSHLGGQDELLVLGLPRGGVVVAYEVAKALEAPLDVLIVRKLGAPQNPEFGFGAIASGGVRYLDDDTVRMLNLDEQVIRQVEAGERQELQRRSKAFRGDRPEPQIEGKVVIVVDDGLATGGTAKAAISAIRQGKPAKTVLAVPVAPPETVERIRRDVDELVCLFTPGHFGAIGQFYRNFTQTTNEEVVELLNKAREELPGQEGEAS
jgi:predicted phosphoribosyltransferase